jgi:biopolymer transport protein ExbB
VEGPKSARRNELLSIEGWFMGHSILIERRNSLLAFLAFATFFWVATMTAPELMAQENAGGEAATPEAPAKENFFFWVARISGVIGLVILGLSVYFVAQVITLFMEFRMAVAMPPTLVQQTNELLEKEDFAGVYNALKGDNSFYARVLTAGMSELPVGLKEAQDVLDRHGDACTVEMEKKISMLAVLGTLGPMIGLLGTLKGMIGAFSEIGRTDQQMKASAVANAISEALLLTFEGVALSVPAIYFFAFFKNRLMAISSATMLAADEFLRKFHAKYKNRQRAAAAAKG